MTVTPPAPRQPLYSEEEVKGILERAMMLQGRVDFARADLEQMAQQLGISPDQLEAAEADYYGVSPVPGESIATLRQGFMAERRRRYLGKLAGVLGTMLFLGMLIVLDISPLSGLAIPFLFITFFSALGTIQESFQALVDPTSGDFEEAFDSWLEQREARRLSYEPPYELPAE